MQYSALVGTKSVPKKMTKPIKAAIALGIIKELNKLMELVK